MNILGIIPARYASTRLEGKPLADIAGKPMIQHVYERARKALNTVVVATDDERIQQAVEDFGGTAIMTSHDHTTGTNRCLEAYRAYAGSVEHKIDVVVNIQGDEPMLEAGLLQKLASSFENAEVEMATLASKATETEDLKDENNVFVVLNRDNNALYFSRSPLPHVRGVAKSEWIHHATFLKHIGLYAFRPNALASFSNMPPSSLEKAESLEQNRWLESGRNIFVQVIEHSGLSVDTPEDLERVRQLMANA